MSLATTLLVAAEEHAAESGPNPWAIGILMLVLLFGAMAALLAFAGGREHS